MATMATPWKHPKTGVYYFRRAVPADAQPKVGKAMIKRSLRTKSPREASRLFAIENAKFEEQIALARSGFELTPKLSRALAGMWLATALEADERAREEGTHWDELDGSHDDPESLGPYEFELDRLRDADHRGDMESVVGADVDALVQQEGLPIGGVRAIESGL